MIEYIAGAAALGLVVVAALQGGNVATTPVIPTYLQVRGNKLYRGDVEVKIKGVNYRGYLKDPYGNWHTIGELIDSPVNGYRTDAVDANLTFLQNAGINCIEVMMAISDWTDDAYVTNFLDFVDRANNHGIIVIIKPTCVFPYWSDDHHTHNLPYGGWTGATITQSNYPAEYALMPSRAAFIDWWSNVANLLKDKTNIILQTYSEPHQEGSEDVKSEYFNMTQQAITVARNVGAQQPIWVGYGWAGSVDVSGSGYNPYIIAGWIQNVDALSDPLGNIILDVHFYPESVRNLTRTTAKAHVTGLNSDGSITGLTIDSPGSNYPYIPLIYIAPYGATRPATVTGIITGGRLTGITITDPGLGYNASYIPSVVIEDAYPVGYESPDMMLTYGQVSGLAAAAANHCIIIGEIGGDPNNPRDMQAMANALAYFKGLDIGVMGWVFESNAMFRGYWDYMGMLSGKNWLGSWSNWGLLFSAR